MNICKLFPGDKYEIEIEVHGRDDYTIIIKEIDEERKNKYVKRSIEIRIELGRIYLSCLCYLGGGDEISQEIMPDELDALLELIPLIKTGEDPLSRAKNLVCGCGLSYFHIYIKKESISVVWEVEISGAWYNVECVIDSNMNISFSGNDKNYLSDSIRQLAEIIWK